MNNVIKIILADDHKIIRDGLIALLNEKDGFEVIAEAGDGRSALNLARELNPDLVIMDVNMPLMNGIEATRQIVGNCKSVRVLALSMHNDRRFVVEMLKAGACGYLLKDCAFEEIIRAIHVIMEGKIYLSPAVASQVVDDFLSNRGTLELTNLSVLTDREKEVLQMLAEGKSTKEIASSLNLSVKTVETHRKKIMDKLNIHTVAELTKFAIREGLSSL